MEQTELTTYAVLVIAALFLGTLAARSSSKREAILSGSPANIFHFLANAIMSVVTLTVLASVFVLRLDLLTIVLTIVGMVVVTLILLMIYAAFEKPALEKKAHEEDRGWTEEDARTSGL